MPARSTVLAVACVCMMTRMAPATPVDFSFKPGTELARVLETVGVMGKFNVLVLPGAGPLRTTYSARLVEPEEALKLLAAAHGLAAHKLPAGPGGSETWVVGTLRQVHDMETETEAVLTVRFASVKSVEHHVLRLVPSRNLTVVPEPRTRRVFLRGPPDVVAKAVALARDLDVPVPSATVHLTLAAGAPGKVQALWKGSQAMVAGEVTKLKLVAQPGKSADAWRASAVDGAVSAQVSADDACTLTAEIEVVIESPAGPVKAVLAATVPAKAGQDVLLASHELGGDRALTLTAKVELVREAARDPGRDGLDDVLDAPVPVRASPSPSSPGPVPPPARSPGGDELDLSTPPAKPTPSPAGTEIDTEL